MDFQRRIRRASEGLSDCELILRFEDIRWLTGFSGSTSCAVWDRSSGTVTLLVDGRYVERAEEETSAAGNAVNVVLVPQNMSTDQKIAEVVGNQPLYVDPSQLTVARAKAIEESVHIHYASTPLTQLRRIKDADEISLISRCANIADSALAELIHEGIAGKTEREVAYRLDSLMHAHGAHGIGFDTIVATGPNGARPHHEPSDGVIKDGHMVIIDFGAEVDGYRSDMTRTIRVGRPSSELEDMFEIVREAQSAGVAAVTAGALGSAVDAAVREVFVREGVEHEYVHGTGHGIGLFIHEEPILSPRCTALLHESEVVTVEPGLYRKGVGGVRIEDLVVVTGSGCRILSHTSKDLSCPPSPQTI